LQANDKIIHDNGITLIQGY